jgi:16S rRNA (guanine966-N2)-methyltransferase
MRIISGTHKGRRLNMPKGIRPTQQKVRKAIFDILGDISGMSFLELYAGSGAVGFEAVSHGVSELVLVEYDRECALALRKNIASLKAKSCVLYEQDVHRAIALFAKGKRKFDIIFLDPPYDEGLAKKTLQMLGGYDILAPNGFIIVQHIKREVFPAELDKLTLFKQARYGDSVLSFYQQTPQRPPV